MFWTDLNSWVAVDNKLDGWKEFPIPWPALHIPKGWSIFIKFSRIDTLSGETALSSLFSLPLEKGSTLKGKNGNRLFPFRADPFQNCCRGSQTGSKKVVSLVKMVTNLPNIFSSLKLQTQSVSSGHLLLVIW